MVYTRVTAERARNDRFTLEVNLTDPADGLDMGGKGKRGLILGLSLDTFPGMGKLRGKQVLGEIYLDMLSLIYILAIEKEMSSVQVQNGVWGRVRVGNINVDVISI